MIHALLTRRIGGVALQKELLGCADRHSSSQRTGPMKYFGTLPASPSAWDHIQMVQSFSRLPAPQRTILTLYYCENLSLLQIAEVVDRSEDDVAADFYWGHVDSGVCVHFPDLEYAAVC